MVTQERINILIQTVIAFFGLIAAVEYFKYGTQANYDWFHCTPKVNEIPNTTILEVTAVGSTACDKRGQLKSVTKRLAKLIDPNIEPAVFCLKEVGDRVIGYGAYAKDEELLSSTYCEHIIHW
jgi:hypothetical protein